MFNKAYPWEELRDVGHKYKEDTLYRERKEEWGADHCIVCPYRVLTTTEEVLLHTLQTKHQTWTVQ